MAKKYIDADRLCAEIEELKGLEYPCDNSEQNVGFEYALDRVSDIINSLQQEQPCDTCTNDKGCVTCKDGELWEGKEVDLDSKVTFDCISKKVTMTVQELINYYIDRECCDVAEECGF